MMRAFTVWAVILAIVLIKLVYGGYVWAGELPFPPALKDEPVEELAYLRTIQRNWNNIPIVTTNPNGARNGNLGDMILYNNSGSWKDCYNIDGGQSWRCSANALTAP